MFCDVRLTQMLPHTLQTGTTRAEARAVFDRHARDIDDAELGAKSRGILLAGLEAIAGSHLRFQDADLRCRQAFMQMDGGKGYITLEDALACFHEVLTAVPPQVRLNRGYRRTIACLCLLLPPSRANPLCFRRWLKRSFARQTL